MGLDLAALLNEVGPLDDEIEAVTQREGGPWVIRFPALDVEVELDAQERRIQFVTVLPPAPADRQHDVYEAILLYNSAWRQTGGVRMALDGKDGPILQIADILAEGATPKSVVTVARNLAERGVIWTKYLVGGSMEASPAPAATKIDTMNFIRI